MSKKATPPEPIDWDEWNRMCDAFGKVLRWTAKEVVSDGLQFARRLAFRTAQSVWELAKEDERQHPKKGKKR